MATGTSVLSTFSKEELRDIFNPVLRRLRTLLNNYEHWPQDDDWPQKVRRAVMGLVTICNKIPPSCSLYAGHSVKALFDLIPTKPEWRQPGTPIDPSFLKNVKKDPPTHLDSFDENNPRTYIDETLQFIAQWRIPSHSPLPTANQSAKPTESKQPINVNEKGKEKALENEESGKGQERVNQGSGSEEEEDGDAEEEDEDEEQEDELNDNENGDGAQAQEEKDTTAIRRSPRKRGSARPGNVSGSGSTFVLCDRCLKAKALAEHSKALGKKFDTANLDPQCTAPGSGSCPRCANGKKKCERLLAGDTIKALAIALKRGRQRKDAAAVDDGAVNQESSTARKSVKRKSAAYIEDSDIDDSAAAAAAPLDKPPTAKKPRTQNVKSKPAPDAESSKAGGKPKLSSKKGARTSKATPPAEPVQLLAIRSSSTAASLAGPSTTNFAYAGTKEFGPLFHPKSGQHMVLTNIPSIPAPADSTVLPAYQTELPTGDVAADLANCASKQDVLDGRLTQAESGIRGLTSAVNKLETASRTPMVPRAEFDDLRRKVAVMEKDFNEREARLSTTVDNTLALVGTFEERMKAYEARMEVLEERFEELSSKVDGATKHSVNEGVAELSAKIEAAEKNSANALSKTGTLQGDVDKFRRDMKGLYVAQDDIRGLLGRMSDAEHELGGLAKRCYDLEADSGEIWERLTNSVNQNTLVAVLDRIRQPQGAGETGRLMDRGTSPNPASPPPNLHGQSRQSQSRPAPADFR
ncbi:hypothetical protein CC2G_006463 [Coprinopsis cinerea AmutBmut pab1-1]|nr:hypothetical protein CC2G_006463 [Coprinopsis cinerea AmutBmut pab1-1]